MSCEDKGAEREIREKEDVARWLVRVMFLLVQCASPPWTFSCIHVYVLIHSAEANSKGKKCGLSTLRRV